MGLIFGVDIVAKGLALGIEDDRHMFRLVILEQTLNHIDATEDGARWLAVRIG